MIEHLQRAASNDIIITRFVCNFYCSLKWNKKCWFLKKWKSLKYPKTFSYISKNILLFKMNHTFWWLERIEVFVICSYSTENVQNLHHHFFQLQFSFLQKYFRIVIFHSAVAFKQYQMYQILLNVQKVIMAQKISLNKT